MITRSEDQINEQYDKARETEHQSQWPGMSYEQGVVNTIEWLTGDTNAGPMDEEED